MNNKLANLRKQYNDLCTKVDALKVALRARQDEARQLKASLEAAALANQTEEARQIMDDLKVMSSTWTKINQEKEQAEVNLVGIVEAISDYYRAAAEDGDNKVDWSLSLRFKEGGLWSDWGGRRDGNIAVIDRELCGPEISFLQASDKGRRYSLCPLGDAYRLVVKYDQYRGTTWGDLVGEQIVEAVAGFLAAGPLAEEAKKFVEGLDIFNR